MLVDFRKRTKCPSEEAFISYHLSSGRNVGDYLLRKCAFCMPRQRHRVPVWSHDSLSASYVHAESTAVWGARNPSCRRLTHLLCTWLRLWALEAGFASPHQELYLPKSCVDSNRAAMELATRSYGVSLSTCSLLPLSSSGRKAAFCLESAKLGTFSITSSWRFLSQNSFQARRPSLVLAAQKPEDPAKTSKRPPSAGVENEASKKTSNTTTTPATREQVLKACRSTSGALAAAGIIIRQGTHWAAEANWPIHDCYADMTYLFESWHLGATAGTVVLIASLRQILLSTWPEFAMSSQQSNKQVLSSLKLNDYLVVSFLPGVSEELFFRGAVLPLVGVDWSGAVVAGLIFGILHLSGGRNAAFAAWASFVGVVYGLAAVYTTNLAVPMVAHSVANLVAAYAWRIEEDNSMKSK